MHEEEEVSEGGDVSERGRRAQQPAHQLHEAAARRRAQGTTRPVQEPLLVRYDHIISYYTSYLML